MTTNNNITTKKSTEFLTKVEVLRNTLNSLLFEADSVAETFTIDPDKGLDFYEHVARFEMKLIEAALAMTGGHQNKAAKLLKLRNSTLSWKIKKLEIKPSLIEQK